MYVTRPLSHYINYPESLSLPPEGPNSGYLVIQDEESEIYSCFGLCKNRDLIDLPFPQNKNLTTRYTTSSGEHQHTSYHDVTFFPVLNKPLSSNQYYVIEPHGKHKGMAYACSKEEDMTTCCFCRYVKDVKPRPFDPHDTYQRFEIANYETACNQRGSFFAKPVAEDAFPPDFLRRKGWQIKSKTPRNYTLGEALGLDSVLRARLPDLNFPLSNKSSKAVVVGKWYCPFMFIKDGTLTSRDQMANSLFYEMTLEQRWEQIFEHDNIDHGNTVMVDAVVQREVVLVGGREAVWDEKNLVDKMIWFKSFGSKGEEVSVGLSVEIVKRMKWEEERAGWVGGDRREVRVHRVEEFVGGANGWRKSGSYVLVERFVLKRMDQSVVMTYDFKHTHQLKCMWE
ncbi:3-ketoacyl-CoA synthase [Heracleum sosnowskyi]|uniref:3-ketoacyl-CoA synthase n=1 Tax=Heracleum sosnowskyi TaxID=360622 RepID=A0AAD8IRV4_9APIA|nr:3-ketoacyl-CoA synthase [Heracleum sosnowskyi]